MTYRNGTGFSGPFYVFVGNSSAGANSLNLCKSGTDRSNPTINLSIVGAANSSAAYVPTITNASYGQASTLTIPDVGSSTASFVMTKGTQVITGSMQINTLKVGASGTVGAFNVYPTTASKGSLRLLAADSAGDTVTTITNASQSGARTYTVPDAGGNASFVMTAGTAATVSVTNPSFGATPVPRVDPASCTISGAAGAANVCTVTVQLKDGSGTNIARSVPFRVYSASAADGLTLQSAASTGYSVASGGLSLANGTAVTTQISAMSSATGGCVLSLTDTGKQTSYLVLVVEGGIKISAQLSSGSYG